MGSKGQFKCMYVALSSTLVTDDYTCSMPTGVDPKLLMEQWRVYWTSVGSLQEQSLLGAGLPLPKDPTAAQLILLASGRLHIVASCWLEGQFDFWSYHSCCFDPWDWECFQITESIDSTPRFLCDFSEFNYDHFITVCSIFESGTSSSSNVCNLQWNGRISLKNPLARVLFHPRGRFDFWSYDLCWIDPWVSNYRKKWSPHHVFCGFALTSTPDVPWEWYDLRWTIFNPQMSTTKVSTKHVNITSTWLNF